MSEEFEFEGKRYSLDYGLTYLDGDAWNYGDYIKIQYPEKEWFYSTGGSCQGEWVSVGRDKKGYWFHKGCYGSCSGCDWLEGISSKESAIEFLKEMKNIIFIGKTWKKAKDYLNKEKNNAWEDLIEAINKIINEIEKIAKEQGVELK